MEIDFFIKFFMWLSILNVTAIILFYILMHFALDFIYSYYDKIYMGSKKEFNHMLINIFLQYRVLTGFFAILPFITLLIINN